MVKNLQKISNQIKDKQFSQRVKILYYARIVLLMMTFTIIFIPTLRIKFGIPNIFVAATLLLLMIIYSTVNHYIKNLKILKIFTFITLIFDNLALMTLILLSGGLQSPIFLTQIVYLIFFVTLFPKPLFTLPPLLMLPVITRVDLLMGKDPATLETIFTIVWISLLNLIIIYFLVLMDNTIHKDALEIYHYQQEMKEKSILEEKNKIARDLHDGVGGLLSSMIIQSEYIVSLSDELGHSELTSEVKELKFFAEESIDEIRRSLNVIKNNFELEQAIYDYIEVFEERNRFPVDQKIISGLITVSSKQQLSIFRVFQELMTNALKHSGSDRIRVFFGIYIDLIQFEIEDYGKGFDPHKNYPGHWGMKNLKERVELLNGTIDFQTELGKGTLVTVTIPNQKTDTVITIHPQNK